MPQLKAGSAKHLAQHNLRAVGVCAVGIWALPAARGNGKVHSSVTYLGSSYHAPGIVKGVEGLGLEAFQAKQGVCAKGCGHTQKRCPGNGTTGWTGTRSRGSRAFQRKFHATQCKGAAEPQTRKRRRYCVL